MSQEEFLQKEIAALSSRQTVEQFIDFVIKSYADSFLKADTPDEIKERFFFIRGFLADCYENSEGKKLIEQDFVRNEMLKFCDHLNTYEGVRDIRFDFMLSDFYR